jgi:glycerol kinase
LPESAHYLVLDQGSHASRAVIFAADGRLVASGEAPVATRRPRPGWVEHDPDEIVASLRDGIGLALEELGDAAARFAAAGLAIQRSSIVCWDRESGAALSPVLSWQDRRNADWLRAQHLDGKRLREITGLVASPHYGASKLRWCIDHLPQVRRALAEGRLCCGPLASFVLHRLLEERPCLVDPANASRTLLWDVRAHDWSAELLEAFGLQPGWLPRCVPSRHAFGTLEVGAHRIPLTVATGDQSAALFARGEPRPDMLYANLGTGAFLQRTVGERPPEAPGLLRGIAWQEDGRQVAVLEGTVNGAGAALDWLAEQAGLPVAALTERAEDWLEGVSDPPLFLNCVGGLGSPYWRASCKSRFSAPDDLAAQTAAVIESIAFLLRVNADAMTLAAGPAGGAARVVASGGLARLDGLCRRLADLLGLPVERPAEVEATARGLAWLLGGTLPADERAPDVFMPHSDAALQARFRRWRRWVESRIQPGSFMNGE